MKLPAQYLKNLISVCAFFWPSELSLIWVGCPVPSIIKSHFAWTWQCATLNRSDEVVSLLMACIQPFFLDLPPFTDHSGQIAPVTREVFGVLALFHETKIAQPGVLFIFKHLISKSIY
jgi:hypothetical protein